MFAKDPSLRSGFRQRAPALLTPALRLNISSKLLLRPARRESGQLESAKWSLVQTPPARSTSTTECRYDRFQPATEHLPSLSRSAGLAPHKSRVPHKNACASAFTTRARKTIWCTGEDSNLRSSEERQIYSLLPLTTRSPVR